MDAAPTIDLHSSAYRSPAADLRATADEAQQALDALRAANPATSFLSAEPSQVPGLVKLTLAGGKLAYSDKRGRYLLMGVIFDLASGRALDGALDAVHQTTSGVIPND